MSYFFSIKDYSKIFKDLFSPKQILNSLYDINLEQLYTEGYKNIFLDVDNTIIKYSEKELSLQRLTWFTQLKAMGFNVFIISNNSSGRRIHKVSKQLGVLGLYFALKPTVLAIKDFAKIHQLSFPESIIIGDQLFTDILMGNWLGAHTILVDPLERNISLIKTIQQKIEFSILNKLGLIKNNNF
jgi:HAD superfamily phosphatase (TIGR01668 family)